MKVLIAGGGIGGLTAALCCLHYGHEVQVFEKSPALGEVGAGIQLPPNAMKVFAALGLTDRLSENAFRPDAIEARMGQSGRTLFNVPLSDEAVGLWCAPYLHTHRADYIDALKTSLVERAPNALRLGAAVKEYDQTNRSVFVTLDTGETVEGDVLIGADGIRSVVREQMHGMDQPAFTGNVAWRATVPIERLGENAPNPTACVWMGKGRHAVTYRLRRGNLANFVGVVERGDWTVESWTERGSKAEALADFADWHPTITAILDAADPDSLFRWALFDRAPLPGWSDGRVTLLGDAAHPMLPFLAQGAAMAVEDGWVLARDLTEARSVEAALKSYESQRLPRTSKVQAASRANMETFHQRTLFGQLKTYGPMWLGGRLAPGLVRQRLSWLYGHDVTAR